MGSYQSCLTKGQNTHQYCNNDKKIDDSAIEKRDV